LRTNSGFARVVDQRWLKTSNGTATDRFQYGYDRGDKRLWRDDLVNSANGELYAYDGLSQQTSFQRGALNGTKTGLTGAASRSQSWDHDAVGNFDSQTSDGTGQTRTHNKQNEITAVQGASNPTYDANGNLKTDQNGQQYAFDAWDRLIEVKNSGGTMLATYEYDGLDRRVSATHGSTTTDFYYSDQWQVLEERVGGNATAQYVWSPVYVDALILRDRDTDANGSLDERLWVQQDANWNVTALIDGSGNVVERYLYDAFGSVTILDGSGNVLSNSAYDWEYLWQGLRLDPATGLYHARYREIHPLLGRPLQRDPLGFDAGDVNLYRWEANQPANVTDPTGLTTINGKVWMMLFPGMENWTKQQWDNYWAVSQAMNPPTMRPNNLDFLPWEDDYVLIEDDDDPAIYGADGNLRRGDLGPAIIDGLEDFGEHMAWYSVEQALMFLSGPALARAIEVLMRKGWKLVNRGGRTFLEDPKTKKCIDIGCFAAGTPVLTPDGHKAIEDLKRGDVVLARSEDDPSAPVQARIVEEVFRRSAPVMTITIGGQQIRLTEEHPFYTLGRGWVKAHELRAGDWVHGEGGEWLPIGKVEPVGDPEVVYNMCVAGAHTFFVGKRHWGFAVWVHNAPGPNGPCPDLSPTPAQTGPVRGPRAPEPVRDRPPGMGTSFNMQLDKLKEQSDRIHREIERVGQEYARKYPSGDTFDAGLDTDLVTLRNQLRDVERQMRQILDRMGR
jgi:RHS repeat-associated protein